MPNWAFGEVTITGTEMDIKSFLQRFLQPSEPHAVEGKKYFARSFLYENRELYEKDLGDLFREEQKETNTFILPVEFAWSASSCVIGRYPTIYPDTCITLQEACKEDQVDVRIVTTEYGLCFSEEITCSASGELEDKCSPLREAVCEKCGTRQSISCFEDYDEAVCCECAQEGLQPVKEGE